MKRLSAEITDELKDLLDLAAVDSSIGEIVETALRKHPAIEKPRNAKGIAWKPRAGMGRPRKVVEGE